MSATGPLAGVRVVEIASIGPGPHCVMLLADMGAEVLRIQRPGGNGIGNPVVDRGRHVLDLDLRTEAGVAACLDAIAVADVLVEGMRPGVMERLGLGPDVALARNQRLIYGRMTGWGQTGPLAKTAGHDLNYVALTGALAAIGKPGEPAVPPLNLVGDFGGGSLYLAFGIAAALFERERSGNGQVIDAAIIDGVSSMMSMFSGLGGADLLSLDRGRNMLSGAAPFYRCYLCADGREISVGAIEPQFYAELMTRIGAAERLRAGQYEIAEWPERSAALAALFAQKTREEWCAILEGTDACFAPVLTLDEAMTHPHMAAREVYADRDGKPEVSPAPRFSRTPGDFPDGGSGEDLLARWKRREAPPLPSGEG